MPRFFLLFLLFFTSLSAHANSLPENISASYSVLKYGLIVAETRLSLKQQDNHLVYSTKTKPEGMASLFTDDTAKEVAFLEWLPDKDKFRLLNYQFEINKNNKKNQTIMVKWDDSKASIINIYKNKERSLQHNSAVWDRLSVQLALMHDLILSESIDSSYAYDVVARGKISAFTFINKKQETLKLANKTYETYLFERSDKKRMTRLWLAPKLNYLPVQMEQYKQGELVGGMQLNRVSIKPYE
jgi:hypothetical protein